MTSHRPLDDADIMLIQRVKAAPLLYDPRNGDFRITARKEEEWDQVASCLNIHPTDARRRWTCLRDRYSRELKQMRLHPNRNEFGRNDFFRQMDFLREFVRKRKERSRRDDSIGNWNKKTTHQNAVVTNIEISPSETEVGDDDEDDDTAIYEDSVQNYDTKLGGLGTTTTSAEAYSMIVEETQEDPYEEYSVQPDAPGLSNETTKHINIAPLILQQSLKPNSPQHHQLQQQQQHITHTAVLQQHHHQLTADTLAVASSCGNEDDYFCKSVAAYLRQLSRRHKIKAKVEIYQILEKFIDLEESSSSTMAASMPKI